METSVTEITSSVSTSTTRYDNTTTTGFSLNIISITRQTHTTIMVAMPSVTMTTESNDTITAVIVPVVVVVLVVCLLVVCAIATIIILYQRDQHNKTDSPGQQESTELYDLPIETDSCYAIPYNGQYNHTHHGHNTPAPHMYLTLERPVDNTTNTLSDDELYSHTHQGHHNNGTHPPPIHSTLKAKRDTPADYSIIAENCASVTEEGAADYAKIPGMPCDDGLYDTTHHRQHNTTTQQLPPPIYSTLAEGGAPADYSVMEILRPHNEKIHKYQ